MFQPDWHGRGTPSQTHQPVTALPVVIACDLGRGPSVAFRRPPRFRRILMATGTPGKLLHHRAHYSPHVTRWVGLAHIFRRFYRTSLRFWTVRFCPAANLRLLQSTNRAKMCTADRSVCDAAGPVVWRYVAVSPQAR
jgi:hypothetical protein